MKVTPLVQSNEGSLWILLEVEHSNGATLVPDNPKKIEDTPWFLKGYTPVDGAINRFVKEFNMKYGPSIDGICRGDKETLLFYRDSPGFLGTLVRLKEEE